MKVMKLALLGTAALAAVSVSVRADDLSDLKAQIEALQADVAALQAAPAVPAGYSLLTMSEAPRIVVPGLDVRDSHGQSATATTIGILPTADMPASTVIQWSGSVRAALVYSDYNEQDNTVTTDDYSELHIRARGRLDVTGTTDTAVGEVGASMSMYADWDDGEGNSNYFSSSAPVKMDYAWGWWKMTPELTFAGGYAGSVAGIGMGIAKINDSYISRGDTHVSGNDFTQFRVSYASGPVGIAIALEHTDEDQNNDGSPLGVAGELTFAGDMFNAEIAGYIRDDNDDTQTQIGAGLGMKLSDMFDVSVAGSIGQSVFYTESDGEGARGDGWEISGAVVATLSDSVSAELGAGMSSYGDNELDPGDGDTETVAVAGGIYWSPVSQLKMGVQASWVDREEDLRNDSSEALSAAFVTWWNF